MAKSRTRKKSHKDSMPPEVSQIVDLAAGYISHWTNKELARMSQVTPLCILTKTGYKIGLYKLVVNKNKTCEVHNPNKEFVHTFDNKISAVLYTIYTIKNNIKKATEIIELDREINKNYMDVLAMKGSQSRARAKKEYDIVDIRQSRLEIAQKQLEIARDKILKIHTYAKYNKVWL